MGREDCESDNESDHYGGETLEDEEGVEEITNPNETGENNPANYPPRRRVIPILEIIQQQEQQEQQEQQQDDNRFFQINPFQEQETQEYIQAGERTHMLLRETGRRVLTEYGEMILTQQYTEPIIEEDFTGDMHLELQMIIEEGENECRETCDMEKEDLRV
jgi:ATP adenylyltransferase/5',5'''-P-1,P-4-tetraphosphate phosphorylase II